MNNDHQLILTSEICLHGKKKNRWRRNIQTNKIMNYVIEKQQHKNKKNIINKTWKEEKKSTRNVLEIKKRE